LGLIILWFAIKQPSVQTWVVEKGISYLENRIGTELEVGEMDVDFWNGISLKRVYLEDEQGGTMLYADHIQTSVKELLFKERFLSLRTLQVDSLYLNLYSINDSTFNYQFLLDEFAGAEDDADEDDSPAELPDIFIEGLAVSNLRLDYLDEYAGLHAFGDIPSISLDVQSMDLPAHEILLKELAINAPEIALLRFEAKPRSPKAEKNETPAVKAKKPVKSNEEEKEKTKADSWLIKLDALNLSEAIVSYVDGPGQLATDGTINFKELMLEPINLSLYNFVYSRDTVVAQIAHFDLLEFSGFKVSKLKAGVQLTSRAVELKNLDFQTPYSKLGQSLTLKYKSLGDFADFINKINLQADFANSHLGLQDLEYFIPVFREKKLLDRFSSVDRIELSGNLKGKINNLRGSDIQLVAGQNIYFSGDVRLRGLPDWENTFIDLEVDQLRTHISDIAAVLPDVNLPSNYERLGNINFNGKFTGFPYDFVADGSLNTEIGSMKTDINMKIAGIASYSGDLQLMDFNVGKLLGDEERFGEVSLQAAIEGKGLNREVVQANLDGAIQKLELNGYSYEDIKIDGTLSKNNFDGKLSTTDENFDLDFNGSVDLSGEVPVLSFRSDVRNLNLKQLQLSNQDISVSFNGDVDLQGSNIDDFIGDGMLENLIVRKDSSSYDLGEFNVSSHLDSLERSVQLNSKNVDANFEGQFRFADLAAGFGHFFSQFFPNRFSESEESAAVLKDINFAVDIKEPIEYVELFANGLTKVGVGNLKGNLDSEKKTLELSANLSELVFEGRRADSISLVAYTDKEFLYFDFSSAQIFYDESVVIPEICLKGNVQGGVIDLNVMAANTDPMNNIDSDLKLFSRNDTIYVDVLGLNAVIAGQRWRGTNGELRFLDQDNYSLSGLSMISNNESISLSSASVPDSRKNITNFNFVNFDLTELMQVLDKENLRVAGTINGAGELTNIFERPVITGEVQIDSAVIFDQHLGNVEASVIKEPRDRKLKIEGRLNGTDYSADVKGSYDLGSSEQGIDAFLDLDVDVREFSIGLLQGIIQDQISETVGRASGKLRVYGSDLKSPNIDGDLLVYGAATKVNYLQTKYSASNTKLRFEQHKIYLDDIVLKDKKVGAKEQNTATANGFVDISDFGDIVVDVRIESENFLFLNTDRHDNQLYYGQVYGGGYVELFGPLSDFSIEIFARSNRGTYLKMPITDDAIVDEDRFFTFIKKETAAEKAEREALEEGQEKEDSRKSNMSVNMKLELTQDAQIELIFDLQAGDIIRSRGSGEIEVNYDSGGAFDVFGNYQIESGDYLFTMQNVVNKNFILQPGGSIDFFGNPYEAIIDLSAVYTAKKTSLYQLMKDTEETSATSLDDLKSNLIDSEVILDLSGTLSSPEVDFGVKIDEAASSVDSNAKRRLEEINNDDDKNELNRQVFGLLVFNNYLPLNQFILDNDWTQDALQTTVSEFLSNQLTSLLSATLHEISPGSDISVNWKNYTASDLDNAYDRNEIELIVSTRFLNDRVIVDVGGNFDLGDGSDEIENQAFLSDFVIQYKITDDGKYRIKVFTKTERDILLGTSRRSGVSLYVSEEFDDFRDLREAFRKRKKERKKKRQEK